MAIPGCISNAIAFLILNRKDMTSSNNYILKGIFFWFKHHDIPVILPNYLHLGIGCWDSLVILCCTLDLGLTSFEIFGFPPSEEQREDFISYFSPVTEPIRYFAYTNGILASLFLTTERYYAICRQISISLEKTKMISYSLILISAVLNIQSCFYYTWGTRKYTSGNYTVAVISEYATNINLKMFGMTSRILLFVIPFTLFLVFNILIIKKVRKINIFGISAHLTMG